MKTHRYMAVIIALFAALVSSSVDLPAQKESFPDLFGQKSALSKTSRPKAEVSVSLLPQDAKAGDTVTLSLTVIIPEGAYTYSTNPIFSGATKFVIEESKGFTSIDKHFNPDHPPRKVFDPNLGDLEKYTKHVIFSRRFKVNKDVTNPTETLLKGQMIYQVCDKDSCTPLNYNFTATLSGKQVSAPLSFTTIPKRRSEPDPIELTFDLAASKTEPEKQVQLTITMNIEKEFHTFALDQDKSQAGMPTHIEIFKLEGLKPVSQQFAVSPDPKVETHGEYTQRTHYNKVVWTREFERIPESKAIGVEGKLRYQLCNENSCLAPLSVEFELGNLTNATPVALSSIEELKGGSDDESEFNSKTIADNRSLALNLFFAFLGGLILNVMPCVLPVVAIKVMSFVQQAGESKMRIFLLNIFYSLGVIAVFVALASLAVFAGLGWGGLFQSTKFNIAMACIVYAMGLSMLGVFEIPVPGLIGSAAGGQQKEGLTGAFLTGILATLLATPCSGPFLGPVLAWSVSQTPGITYLVWIVMGLGMASPYLLFSVFPKAISHLPKPGMWMVRFKEFSGIVLMGAVIFIISTMDVALTIPVLIMLLGITTGLWMIGSLYEHNSSTKKKMTVRGAALLLTTAICLFGYQTSQKSAYELPWVPFSTAELQQLRSENKTVLIDFSAKWCLTCKLVEKNALNTQETLEMVEKYNVVPMYADYTERPDHITEWLDKFKSISIPLTVIFPANQPNKPIIIRDVYTQATLLHALEEAVNAPAIKKPTKQSMVSKVTPH